jgi:hypothetical protein
MIIIITPQKSREKISHAGSHISTDFHFGFSVLYESRSAHGLPRWQNHNRLEHGVMNYLSPFETDMGMHADDGVLACSEGNAPGNCLF